MDEIVKAAMAKWPDVPDVYGWLRLDARGQWWIREGRVDNRPLMAFIWRNWACDARGAWFFQNGPQRVFARLDAAPFVVRLSADGLQAGDGRDLTPQAAWLTPEGELYLQAGDGRVALLDDRDLGAVDIETGAGDEPQEADWPALFEDGAAWRVRLRADWLPLYGLSAEAVAARGAFIRVPTD